MYMQSDCDADVASWVTQSYWTFLVCFLTKCALKYSIQGLYIWMGCLNISTTGYRNYNVDLHLWTKINDTKGNIGVKSVRNINVSLIMIFF